MKHWTLLKPKCFEWHIYDTFCHWAYISPGVVEIQQHPNGKHTSTPHQHPHRRCRHLSPHRCRHSSISKKYINLYCVFCKNNKETLSFYSSHVLKNDDGKVVCPVLRAYTCPICKASGDRAHTLKYCPMCSAHLTCSYLSPPLSPQSLHWVPYHDLQPHQLGNLPVAEGLLLQCQISGTSLVSFNTWDQAEECWKGSEPVPWVLPWVLLEAA